MSKQIPGAMGDPLPAPAITENTWESIRGDHQLIYLGKDWVLDWVPSSGDFRVFLIERDPAAGADPLPESPICFGNWAGIRTGHELVYLGGDRLLDWQPNTKRFRVWLINRAATGNTDPIPGVPQTDGLWTSIDADHRLISLGNDRVLDWVPSTGDYRLWRHDPLTVGAADPLPAPPLNQGRWSSIRSDRRLIPVGKDRVLDWKPSTGDYRVWLYDRAAADDPFPGEPEVVGQWTTIRESHNLLYVERDRVIDWEGNGHFRLYRYDRNVTTLRLGTVRVHFRVVVPPFRTTLQKLLTNAKTIYASYGIDLVKASEKVWDKNSMDSRILGNMPENVVLVVGSNGEVLGQDQLTLFSWRDGVGTDEIVVYFVHWIMPPREGDANHPPGSPGVAVASLANEWVLAHELGHILVGDHAVSTVDSIPVSERLMRKDIANAPKGFRPQLTTSEVNNILNGPFLKQ